jgi:3'-phosphoadenosine 5'-phosphosulfate sulfotransferase (PAPS reductase)/FAD synthetase
MEDLILRSKEVYDFAMDTYKPRAVVLMLSGGDDSLTCAHVAKELGIKIDFVIHGNTRTGINDTTEFAIQETEKLGHKLLLADAGDSYINYVMRKGFFGKGNDAHNYSYHILKWNHFSRVVSANIRQRKRNFPILFLNGARQSESERRKITMVSPYNVMKGKENNIWVNLINHWDRSHCLDYLNGNSIKRNPVSVNLCRSGECMCGTMQTQGDRTEAGFFYPDWKKWIDSVEKAVKEKHGWGWNDNMPKPIKPSNQIELFQPMCSGCKVNFGTNIC